MAETRTSPPNTIEELTEALGDERFNSIVDKVLRRYCEAQEAESGLPHYTFQHDNGDPGFYGDKPGVIKALEDAIDSSGDWPPRLYFEKRSSEQVLDDIRGRYWSFDEELEAENGDMEFLTAAFVSDLKTELKDVVRIDDISSHEWNSFVAECVSVEFDYDEIVRATVLPVDIELRASNAPFGEYDETIGALHQTIDYALHRCDLDAFEASSLSVLCEQQGFTLGEMLAAGENDGFKTQLRDAVGELIGNESGFCARPVLLASLDVVSFAQLACGEATGVEIDAKRAASRTEFGACIALFDGSEGSGELIVTAACDRPLVFPTENIEAVLPDNFDSGALGLASIRETFGLVESVWDAPCMLCSDSLEPIEITPEAPAALAHGAKLAYDRAMGFEPDPELEEAPSRSKSFDAAMKRASDAATNGERFAEDKKPDRQCRIER